MGRWDPGFKFLPVTYDRGADPSGRLQAAGKIEPLSARPPSQGWRIVLRDRADGIAAMDMFVGPTISFRLLYGLLPVGHGPRAVTKLRHAHDASMKRPATPFGGGTISEWLAVSGVASG
jgi:hypothetical protein